MEGFLICGWEIIIPGCGVTGLDTHRVQPSRARDSNRGGEVGIQREIDNASPTPCSRSISLNHNYHTAAVAIPQTRAAGNDTSGIYEILREHHGKWLRISTASH